MQKLFIAGVGVASAQSAKHMMNGEQFDPYDFPVEVTRKLMCQACMGATTEFMKILPHMQKVVPKSNVKARRAREIDVVEAMERTFCQDINFSYYTSYPPELSKNCKAFLDEYNEDSEVEIALTKGGAPDVARVRVCGPVCEPFPEEEWLTTYFPEVQSFDGGGAPPGGGMPYDGAPPSGGFPPGGMPPPHHGGGMPLPGMMGQGAPGGGMGGGMAPGMMGHGPGGAMGGGIGGRTGPGPGQGGGGGMPQGGGMPPGQGGMPRPGAGGPSGGSKASSGKGKKAKA